jgi:exodeoxyribonuclease-3
MRMNIITWNVNGFRAAVNKGILDWIEHESPDVVCLQEVRARPEQLEPGWIERLEQIYPLVVWNPGERPGYSGVAVFSKTNPLEMKLGLDAPIYDAEGRVIRMRFPGFSLFNIYFPNGGHDLSRVPFKLDFYAYLLEICNDLHSHGERVVLGGDFNTAHREIDLKNPRENEHTSGFLPEERVWIDHYLEKGFVDAFRELYPQREAYTWWTYRFRARQRNIGWRLDYFLVSEGLMGQVQDVVIHDQVEGSDHCPVGLVVNV